MVTPSGFYVCRDASVPVVATIHNYKLGYASGSLSVKAWFDIPAWANFFPRWHTAAIAVRPR